MKRLPLLLLIIFLLPMTACDNSDPAAVADTALDSSGTPSDNSPGTPSDDTPDPAPGHVSTLLTDVDAGAPCKRSTC